MKKIFALAAIALFTLASCSSDSDSQPTNPGTNPADSVLLKKVIETSADGVDTQIYTYNGTKLDRISYSDGSYDKYTYDVNFDYIIKIEYFNSEHEIHESLHFEYDLLTGKLVEMSDYYGNSITVTEFTYNNDGTISYTRGNGFQHGVIYDTKLSQYTQSVAGGGDYLLWLNYEFDTQNDPMLNVTGMDKIAFAFYTPQQFGHNITNDFTTREDGSLNQQLQTSTFTYNSQGYPATEHRVEYETFETEVQYFYE